MESLRIVAAVVHCCSVAHCVRLFATPWAAALQASLSVLHQLPEFGQTHVHWVSDVTMPLWWQNGEIFLEVVCNKAINSNMSVLGGGYCGRIGPQFMLLPGRGPAPHPIAPPDCVSGATSEQHCCLDWFPRSWATREIMLNKAKETLPLTCLAYVRAMEKNKKYRADSKMKSARY